MNDELFGNKYRISTTRLKDWDYSSFGYYYVTICTRQGECFFGDVEGDEMALNAIGMVADKNWQAIPSHYKLVTLDEFKVMPNHIHGILVINTVETCHGMSLPIENKKRNEFSKPIKGSLWTIINQYKGSIQRWCNQNNRKYFDWQPGYYEHIIRTERALQKIREYIHYNVLKWNADKYNPLNSKSWLYKKPRNRYTTHE